MPPIIKNGLTALTHASQSGRNAKGKVVARSTTVEITEAPKQASFEEKMAQLDYEDVVFKEVISLLPKGKGLADSMWADPGTKPLVIAPNNIFGMRTDYIYNPVQDNPRPSSPTPSSLNPEAENFAPLNISSTVSAPAKSTFSQQSEAGRGHTSTPLSTPSKSFPATTISLGFNKMVEYVPPHRKDSSGAKILATPKAAKNTSPHLEACINPKAAATLKADHYLRPHLKQSSSANVTAASEVPICIPPHPKGSPSANIVTALKATQHTPPHTKCSPGTDSVDAPKATGHIPPHLRSKSNFEKVSKNCISSAISSEEVRIMSPPIPSNIANVLQCKPMTKAPHSPAPRVLPTENGKIHLTVPAKVAAVCANISATPTQEPSSQPSFKLASSWEEFTRGKETLIATNVIHSTVGNSKALPMNTTSFTNVFTPVSTKSTQEKPNPSISHLPANCASTTIKEQVEYSKQPNMTKPIGVHSAIVHDICLPAESKKPDLLTRAALIKTTGAAPPESVVSGVEQAVSDDGVEESAQLQNERLNPHDGQELEGEKHVPDARGNLAPEAIGLQEWDGSWAPVPCSWEYERNGFCNDFIPTYIAEWRKDIEQDDSQTIDMKADEFTTGTSPLCNKKFLAPIQHPLSYPDVLHSENLQKQRMQHAELDCKHYLRRQLRKKRNEDRSALLEAQRRAEIDAAYEAAEPEPNPYAPTIAIYLRPAQERDVPGITEIYNHYVRTSIVPEDQEPVDERDIRSLLSDVRSDALPFIVAILGTPPKDPSSHGKKYNSRYPTTKSVAQSKECVVGFAYINTYFGLASTASGRSRYTGNLQFYVHPKYTRKGVGRCLLDRILMCTCSTHCGCGGYDWVEPKDSMDARVYCDGGGNGPRRYHQLLIERPIETKFDPDHEWLKRWLHSFFFMEVARFLSTARSRARGGGARWLDVVTFQKSATTDGDIQD